jgi:hypothetical protein
MHRYIFFAFKILSCWLPDCCSSDLTMEHLYSYASFLTRPSISPDDSSKNESLKLLDLVDYIYILRPSLGQKEGNEFERVMYFYPDTYPSQSQVAQARMILSLYIDFF